MPGKKGAEGQAEIHRRKMDLLGIFQMYWASGPKKLMRREHNVNLPCTGTVVPVIYLAF